MLLLLRDDLSVICGCLVLVVPLVNVEAYDKKECRVRCLWYSGTNRSSVHSCSLCCDCADSEEWPYPEDARELHPRYGPLLRVHGVVDAKGPNHDIASGRLRPVI